MANIVCTIGLSHFLPHYRPHQLVTFVIGEQQVRNKGRNPHRRSSWKLVGNPDCELDSN